MAVKMNKSFRKGLSNYFRSHPHPGGIIVCENMKFIYMKPTKTAGTSILRGYFEKNITGIIHYKDNPSQFQSWLDSINDEELKKYFIFAVVRNPWDRLVSVASYFKIPFKDFILNIEKYWENPDIRIHSLPLHLYTHVNGRKFVDAICRFENIQSDFDSICDQIGINKATLPIVNKSKHEHYSIYYGHRENEILNKLYAKDIELFHYFLKKGSPVSIRQIILKDLQEKFRYLQKVTKTWKT